MIFFIIFALVIFPVTMGIISFVAAMKDKTPY